MLYKTGLLWAPEGEVPEELLELATYKMRSTHAEEDFLSAAQLDGWMGLPREICRRAKGRYDIQETVIQPTVSVFADVQPRDALQVRTMAALREAPGSGVLCLPCGKGKPPMGIYTASLWGGPVLVFVPDTTLAAGWIRAFSEFCCDMDGGKWFGGSKQVDREMVVATFQSVHTLPPREVRERFATVIVDETHVAAAETFAAAVGYFPGRRLGLSATPYRSDGLTKLVFDHMGPMIFSESKQDQTPRIVFLDMKTRLERTEVSRYGRYDQPTAWRTMSQARWRTKLIVKATQWFVEEGRKILLLVGPVKLGENLAEMLGCPFVCGENTKGHERAEIIEANQVTVATLGVAEMGLDVPSLDTVIQCTPVRSKKVLTQAAGRALRSLEGKKEPVFAYVRDTDNAALAKIGESVEKILTKSGIFAETPTVEELEVANEPSRSAGAVAAAIRQLHGMPVGRKPSPRRLRRR